MLHVEVTHLPLDPVAGLGTLVEAMSAMKCCLGPVDSGSLLRAGAVLFLLAQVAPSPGGSLGSEGDPPRSKQDGPPGWTVPDCLLILGLCLVFEFVVAPLVSAQIQRLSALGTHRFSGILLLYLAVFALPLVLILPAYMRLKFKRPFLDIGFRSARPLRHLLAGGTWFGAYLAGLLLVSWVLVQAVFPGLARSDLSLLESLNPQQLAFFRTARQLLAGMGLGHWLLFGAVMGIAVPILEEAYFRGCVLPALRNRWGPRVALVGSAFAFAALHLNGLLLPIYFLLGILTGILYMRTGNLLAPVAFHSLNNLASLAVLHMIL